MRQFMKCICGRKTCIFKRQEEDVTPERIMEQQKCPKAQTAFA